MVLKDILSIAGEPGLFKFVAQGKNSMIIEHLETKRRTSAFGSAKVSSLEEISVYTEKEDIALGKVFDLIFEKHGGGPAPDYKSDPAKLKTWFGEVLPEYDRDKVYVSDIKKVAHWYNILQGLNLLVKDEPAKVEETVEGKIEEMPEKGKAAKKKEPETVAAKKKSPASKPKKQE
jgi:hypothetical protein